jgi:hypothetical protein
LNARQHADACTHGSSLMRDLGKYAMWSMKADRELIELAKTESLEAIADQFQLPPKSILKKAAKLGLTIKRKGQKRAPVLQTPFSQ